MQTKEIVILGGIKYRVRKSTRTEAVLTLPYGTIEYIAPVRGGVFVGLPITKGYKYQGN